MTTDKTDDDRITQEAIDLAAQIAPKLHGHPPYIQGAALADLVAIWLAGHPPFLRDTVFENWRDAVTKLTAVNERIMFGPDGHPTKEPW